MFGYQPEAREVFISWVSKVCRTKWEDRGAEGAEVERRKREDRGAEGAEGGGVWEGGVPLPTGGGVWGGGCAPSPEIFWISDI